MQNSLGKLTEMCQDEEEAREKSHIDALALARSSMSGRFSDARLVRYGKLKS